MSQVQFRILSLNIVKLAQYVTVYWLETSYDLHY